MQKLSDAPVQAACLPAQRVAEMASRLSRSLGVARALAEGGRRLDLRGFEDGVGLLCAQTLDLPTDDARGMVFTLREILAQVDGLAEILARDEFAGAGPGRAC